MLSSFLRRIIYCIFLLFISGQAAAQAVPVRLEKNAVGNWVLLREGKPYYIKGAGGSGSKAMLKECGANTFRTWGVSEDLGDQLDEAHELGLTVAVGLWLGHPRHGFDYSNQKMLEEQFNQIKKDVIKYKDHPAVLLWGIGNEMEGFEAGNDPNVWNHVQELAAMIKELDPNHPTMTVTAEIGGSRVPLIHELCPDIDIVGINSYGGVPSLPQRYRDAGGSKPYIITEFGPPGSWETKLTKYGAPPELSSTDKAEYYRNSFLKGCLQDRKLCLGGFAFTWGAKMEVTSTWYGMFLKTGEKLGAVDAMQEVWTGTQPVNLCPKIISFELIGPDVVNPEDTVQVNLEAIDLEGSNLRVEWKIFHEAPEYHIGETTQWTPLELDKIIIEASNTSAKLIMPDGGIYRLYVTVYDDAGGAATANVPLKVTGKPGDVFLKLPLAVYADSLLQPWFASGYMGDYTNLKLDEHCKTRPHSGENCLEVYYKAGYSWTGTAWQHPANDWGDKPGGYNLTGATKLTFWARGEMGGEIVDFRVGLLKGDKEFHDTAFAELKGIKLKNEWKKYTIKLKQKDLSQIKTPFAFTMMGTGHSQTFYLDDIYFE